MDKVTGIQYLFGGATTFAHGMSGSIFRAVYDPAAPGKLRWDKDPELSGTGRVMCFAEADGVLYAAGGIKDETPLSGGLFRRVDGEKPRWELLWRWPHLIQERGDETVILRGLTAIPDPKGGKHQVLLGTCHYPGVVYRIDPGRGFAVTTELDIRAYFAKAFGVAKLAGPCLSAYNNFLPATDPDTGEKVLLLGVWVNHPGRKRDGEGRRRLVSGPPRRRHLRIRPRLRPEEPQAQSSAGSAGHADHRALAVPGGQGPRFLLRRLRLRQHREPQHRVDLQGRAAPAQGEGVISGGPNTGCDELHDGRFKLRPDYPSSLLSKVQA